MTDTGAYTDVVFGLFRLLGYHFCPRLADIGGTRFWRIDPLADYGKLNVVSQHRLKLQRIAPHWNDMLRLSGSLLQGRVPATGIMRKLLLPAAHVITAKHTCPARPIALAYPGFPSICYSNP